MTIVMTMFFITIVTIIINPFVFEAPDRPILFWILELNKTRGIQRAHYPLINQGIPLPIGGLMFMFKMHSLIKWYWALWATFQGL